MNVLVRYRGENGKTLNAKNLVQKVRHVYQGGRVRTVSGDTWNVKPADHKDYQFITVERVDR